MLKNRLIQIIRQRFGRESLLLDLLLDLLLWGVPFAIRGLLLVENLRRGRPPVVRRSGAWRRRLRTRILKGGLDAISDFLEVRRPGDKARRRLRSLLYFAGSRLMSVGDLTLAARCFDTVLQLTPPDSKAAVHDNRVLGAAHFMRGDLSAAHDSLRCAGLARSRILAGGAVSRNVRFLGPGWFVAIGHVAMLDFYFKKRALGLADPGQSVLLTDAQLAAAPGRDLLLAYRAHGLEVIRGEDAGKVYDQRRAPSDIPWHAMSEDEKYAAMDDFWEYDFGGGDVLTYTHGAARLQQRWEAEGRAPLLALDADQRVMLAQLLREMGVPEGAWYVCLHVREAGFHARWNAIYPSARDADIGDYDRAVRTIRERGGYVVRVGDPSMKRLAPQDGVFDYAHSNLKSRLGDILIAAGCRFFLGTNSGYATVPGIYGVPNVLTNWVPVALPLWFGIDLMIPKPFYDNASGRYVDFDTVFGSQLGAMQNATEFPAHIEVRANTPEQIDRVVIEMLDRLDGRVQYTDRDEALQACYHELAIRNGAYRGSRIGRDFLREYEHLLPAV